MVAQPEGQKYRSEHDPFNGIEEPNIRPSFLARQELSDAEKTATKQHDPSEKSNSLKSREESQTSDHFINSVTGRRNQSSEGRHGATSRRLISRRRGRNEKITGGKSRHRIARKLAPLTIIVSLLFGGGALFYLSQSILGPHLSSLYTSATDLQYTSYNMRNQRLFRYMLNGDNQIKISRFSKRYTTFTPYMKKRLKQNGIEVGYIDTDGTFKSNQLLSNSKTVLKYNDEIIDANAFQNKFASDPNFRDSYYKAKRGRVAGFFDSSAERYYKKKGATRDIFNQYKSTGDDKKDTEAFQKTVSDRVAGSNSKVNTVSKQVDEDGEEHAVKNGADIDAKNIDGDTPETKARTMVNSIAGKVSNVGVPACSALRIANMAAVTVSAYNIFQSIAYFLSFMEPTSKMMAGEGDVSGINESLNFLTTETTSTVNYVAEDGSNSTKTVTGSPLQSTGAKLILGDTRSPASETAPYSMNSISRAAKTIVYSTGATNIVCDGVMASSAIISLVSNSVPGGALANFIVSAVAHTFGGIIMTGVVSAVVSAIIPQVAKIFASNVFEAYTGVPAGELFSQGAVNANFRLSTQASAYMPASEEYIKTQNHKTTLTLAEEAEIDRNRHNPFDASSENTFLGSLLSKFAFLSYSNNFGILSNLANIVGKSIRSLTPTSSAYDEDSLYTSNYQNCDNLDDTVCEMYGIEIVGTDYSTIDLAPDDPTYVSIIEPNLDEDGKIKKKSNLAKFITSCVERESPWGTLDINIMNALQTDFGAIGNNLFLIDSAVDIINAAEDVANRGWGTGENCRMSKDNPGWDSEYKYYQRYVEDMRILDGFSDKSENPVIAYLDEYDTEHPIDTSFEGTLARISGNSKEDIAFLLEFKDYAAKIANYNPSTRYKFSTAPSSDQTFTFSETISPAAYIGYNTPYFVIDKRNYTV